MKLPKRGRDWAETMLGLTPTDARPTWDYTVGQDREVSGYGEVPDGTVREWRLEVTRREAWNDETLARNAKLARDDAYFRSVRPTSITYDLAEGRVVRWEFGEAALDAGHVYLDPHDFFPSWGDGMRLRQGRYDGTRPLRKLTMHLWEASWSRHIDGLRVEGEHMRATVNTSTAQFVSYARSRWKPMPPMKGPPMPEADARRIAADWAAEHFPAADVSDAHHRIEWVESRHTYARVWSFWLSRSRPADADELALAAVAANRISDELDMAGASEAEAWEEPAARPDPGPPLVWETATVGIAEDGQVVRSTVQ